MNLMCILKQRISVQEPVSKLSTLYRQVPVDLLNDISAIERDMNLMEIVILRELVYSQLNDERKKEEGESQAGVRIMLFRR